MTKKLRDALKFIEPQLTIDYPTSMSISHLCFLTAVQTLVAHVKSQEKRRKNK